MIFKCWLNILIYLHVFDKISYPHLLQIRICLWGLIALIAITRWNISNNKLLPAWPSIFSLDFKQLTGPLLIWTLFTMFWKKIGRLIKYCKINNYWQILMSDVICCDQTLNKVTCTMTASETSILNRV